MLVHRNQFHYGIVRVLHSARILSIIDFPGAVVLGPEQEAVIHISSGQPECLGRYLLLILLDTDSV